MRLPIFFIVALLVIPVISVDSAEPKVLVLQLDSEPATLCPFWSESVESSLVYQALYNTLVQETPETIETSKLSAELAERWESSDDGLTHTFHLRKDVKWHDGKGFTSKDVIFSFKTYMTREVAYADYETLIDVIKSVEAKDKYTVVFHFNHPYPYPIGLFADMEILPEHYWKDVDPVEIRIVRENRNPIGTGAYKFSEWRGEQYITLEKFDDYFKGAPKIDKIFWKIIPDRYAQIAELKTGGVHLLGRVPHKYMSEVEDDPNIELYDHMSFVYGHIFINLHHPVLKEKAVRQAISYLIDRQQIIDTVGMGYGEVACGPIAPVSWAYNPDLNGYDYNPAKAKELLKDAGWRIGVDGIYEKAGRKLEWTMSIPNSGSSPESCQLIQQWLKASGIKMNIRMYTWPTVREMFKTDKVETTMFLWVSTSFPELRTIYYSEGSQNYNHFSNTEFDELQDEFSNCIDKERVKEILFRQQQILNEDLPYIYIDHPIDTIGIRKDSGLRGYVNSPVRYWDWNIDEWEIS